MIAVLEVEAAWQVVVDTPVALTAAGVESDGTSSSVLHTKHRFPSAAFFRATAASLKVNIPVSLDAAAGTSTLFEADTLSFLKVVANSLASGCRCPDGSEAL